MTARVARVVLVFCLALAAWFLVVSAALADGPEPYNPDPGAPTTTSSVSVVSTATGVTIVISMSATTPGTPDTPGSQQTISSPSGPSCTATAMNIGYASANWVREGAAENPGTTPWGVNCNNGYFGVAWVPVDAPGAPDVVVNTAPTAGVDPAAIAASVLGIVPLPPIAVGANPGVGLVALPSWFWVDGYDGSTLRGSRSLGLIVVEVEITPERYDWSFGDGATLQTTSLGRPYPEVSDIRHVYEQSSLNAGGQYQVRLDITFRARYRANGGAWQPLAPIVQPFTRLYAVQQLQSVLTSSR